MDRARRLFDGALARDSWPRDTAGAIDVLLLAYRAETAMATGGATQATAWLERAATVAAPSSTAAAAFLLERAAVAAWRGGDRRRALDLVLRARAETTHASEVASLALLELLARAGALDARGDPRLGDPRCHLALLDATAPRATGPPPAFSLGDGTTSSVLAAIALAAGDERRAAALLGVSARLLDSKTVLPLSPLGDARRRTAAWLAARLR
jgi:hypothetical protein